MAATSHSGAVAGLTIAARQIGDVTVLDVSGELDLSTAPKLCARLEQTFTQPRPRVLLDLSRLNFCDSTGLRALAGAAEEARIRRARLRIVRPSASHPARTFAIAGGAEFLPLADQLSSGLQQLAS